MLKPAPLKTTSFSQRVPSLLTFALLAGAAPVHAANVTWSAAGGGNFLTPGNWSPASVPTDADIAIFSNTAAGTVTFSGNATVDQLSFRKPSGALTFDLGGNTLGVELTNGIAMGTAATQANDITFTNGTINGFAVANNVSWSLANLQNNKLTFTGAGTNYTATGTGSTFIGSGAGAAGNVMTISNGANYSTGNRIGIGVVSTTATTNRLDVIDATLTIAGTSRGIQLQSGTFNQTNSTVTTAYVGAADDTTLAGYSGSLNFNSGQLNTRAVRMTAGKVFYVGDGGAIDANLRMDSASAVINAASGMHVRSNGSIAGNAAITGNITGDAGASMSFSVSPPTNRADTTITGNFDASNFDLTFRLGDFPAELAIDLAAPRTFTPPQDQLIVTGVYTQANSIMLDLSTYVAPEDMAYELKLIGWGSTTGIAPAVSFINGDALAYEYRADGLYVIADVIPEPASLAIVALGGLMLAGRRHRR